MKKIKIMKIVLIVILSLVIIGLIMYNCIGILMLTNAVGLGKDTQDALLNIPVQKSPYDDVESNLIASGIAKDRVKQISDNVKSQKHIKEAFGDKYEETMQHLSDNHKNQEELLKSTKDLKWYSISYLKFAISAFFEEGQF